MISSLLILCFGFGGALCVDAVVECPAPRSPDGGQAFLLVSGRAVKFVCDPGRALIGRDTLRCVGGQWENESPLCVEEESEPEPKTQFEPLAPPRRPLFKWGDDDDVPEPEVVEKANVTSGAEEQADQPVVQTILVPGRRARVRSANSLEAENRRRAGTVRVSTLRAPPPVLYVRSLGKSGDQLQQQYSTAAAHARPEQVQVVQLPRAPATQNDKGEDYLRHMYWVAAANYHSNPSAVLEYYQRSPMALSHDQMAWINSLPADLRDRYLRDLYVLRAEEAVEGQRADAFLRRTYAEVNGWYQVRQAEHVDAASIYDYSCNQSGHPFVRAPRVPNAHVHRYDRRQNPRHPRNHYLTAVYRCDTGHRMLDSFAEMHCSGRRWVGNEPICVLA